jgi:aspartate/tyrosine/aromatic aminotransferase
VDPDASDWDEVVSLAKEHGWLPLIDLAYQGFGSGLDQDASAVRGFVDAGLEVVIAHSYSKNFGLYAERVGALTLVAQDTDAAAAVESQVKSVVRANYSNPPKHGAAIVATILSDDDLTAIWKVELVEMCERIHDLRRQLVAGLADRKIDRDMSFITQQKGMFSYSGLTPDQVDQLKNQHGIYMLRSGRMNVAGLNSKNLEVVCDAMASVMNS